jgi:hypothetical protein
VLRNLPQKMELLPIIHDPVIIARYDPMLYPHEPSGNSTANADEAFSRPASLKSDTPARSKQSWDEYIQKIASYTAIPANRGSSVVPGDCQ